MKSIYTILIIMLVMLVPAYGATLSFDQVELANQFQNEGHGNVGGFAFTGGTSEVFGADSLIFGNTTIPYDAKREYPILNEEIIFYFDNLITDLDMDVYVLHSQGTMTKYPVHFTNTGIHYIKLVPDSQGEEVTVFFDAEFLNATTVFIGMHEVNTQGKTISDVGQLMLQPFIDMMDIVNSIWKLAYFLLISIVVVTTILLLVSLGFTVVEWAEKFSDKRRERIYRRRI